MRTVVVCDTEPVAIEGLRGLLESEGLRVVAAENNVADAMDSVRALRPALVIVDKAFGMTPVLEALRQLRDSAEGARTVVWGSSLSEPEALNLLRAGAAGIVRKTARLSALMDCVKAVLAGGSWIEETLIAGRDSMAPGCYPPLTGREMQIMELVERGLRNRDIAAELGIQVGTVKIHLKHIFEKTGVRGRYGLALSGFRHKRPSVTQ